MSPNALLIAKSFVGKTGIAIPAREYVLWRQEVLSPMRTTLITRVTQVKMSMAILTAVGRTIPGLNVAEGRM